MSDEDETEAEMRAAMADVGRCVMDLRILPAPMSLRAIERGVAAYRKQLAAVEALIAHARKISPSDRMCVYVGDLEQALGMRDERARTRTGSNGA